MEWNVMRLVESWVRKGSLRDKRRLGLVHGLKAHEGTYHTAYKCM